MNSEIVESFSQMVREKGIDKDILVGIVEDVFSMMVRKRYGQEAKFDVVVNMEKGDIEIFLERAVVETVEDPTTQIAVEEARRLSGEVLVWLARAKGHKRSRRHQPSPATSCGNDDGCRGRCWKSVRTTWRSSHWNRSAGAWW